MMKSPIVRLLPGTREKLERIADVRRWKLNVVIDAAVDKFAESEGISIHPQPDKSRRRKVSAA